MALGPFVNREPGLLLAYEKTGYDANTPGRLPDLLDNWSVRRLKEAGADCIKILLYYNPVEGDKITRALPGTLHHCPSFCLISQT